MQLRSLEEFLQSNRPLSSSCTGIAPVVHESITSDASCEYFIPLTRQFHLRWVQINSGLTSGISSASITYWCMERISIQMRRARSISGQRDSFDL